MNFLFPSFLYALASIAIPVIIHLVELRRAKRVVFTNLNFIKDVKNVTASHRQLKRWLILLARIFFIIFLVLLFSQPYRSTGSQNALSTNRAKIFVDNSFSMQNEAKASENSLLQMAIDQASRITQLFNVNSSYQLGTHSKLSYVDLSKSNFQKQLNTIKESANNRSMATVFSWFNQEEDRQPFKGFIISDFQKSSIKTPHLVIPDTVNEYYLVPVQSATNRNVFIDTVYSEDAFIRQNENNVLQVKLRNAGNEDVPDCQVKFFIGNKQVSALSVDVPANRTVPFTLNYRLSSNQTANCRLVVDDFPVTFDNTYYFNLKPSENIKILEVNGQTPIGDKLFTNEDIFKYTASAYNNINYKQIGQADYIILNGVTDIDAPLADNLRTFVQEGGTILIIPAAKPDLASYQAFLGKLQLTQVQTTGNNPENKKSLLAYPDTRNPFFQDIFSEPSRNSILPSATKAWRWNRSASDILTFKEGGSFLSSFGLGNGQVYLFASPLTEEYSDFQNNGLFVPVMYKMAMLSSRQQQPLAYALNNRIFAVPFNQDLPADQVVQLRKDSLAFIPEQQTRKNQLVLGIPAEVNEAGFYDLMQKDKVLATLAFNHDKKESDLKQFSVEELRSNLAGQKNVHVLDTSNELNLQRELTNENLGVPLWKYCLILCLVFMFTEILLIRYF